MRGAPPILEPAVEARPRAARFAAAALLAVFALCLLLPLAATDFGNRPRQSATEKRTLALFPEWRWEWGAVNRFPAAFDAAFNDRFGFRAPMVRWVSRLKVRWHLGILSKPEVVLGRGGWLYLAGTVKEARGISRVKPGEAEAWARYIRVKNAWLAARGVSYLFVIVPNKEWVYPEFLPRGMEAVPGARFSDRLAARLGEEPGLPVLDLRGALVEAKPLGLVFERTDTHWSQLGAFVATGRILERLGEPKTAIPQALEARHPRLETGPGGDLAMMLSLPDVLTERRLVIDPRPGAFAPAPVRFALEWPPGACFALPAAYESPLPECRQRMLLVGNSFTEGLLRTLPEHFRRVVRLRPDTPYTPWFHAQLPGIIAAEKPDFYLEVLSERSLRKAPEAVFPGP